MPLEPLEEGDFELKDKFLEKKEGKVSPEIEDVSIGEEKVVENVVERKEGVIEKDDAYSKIVAKVQAQSPQTAYSDIATDAIHTTKLIDTESRINNLVDIAMQKGVVHAAKVAQHMNDNYILDEFHDKLMMDEFHAALIEKGLIEDM